MKRLLLVTFDPELVMRGRIPDDEVEKVKAAGQRIEDELQAGGIEITDCRIDLGERAEAILREALARGPIDGALIGAGIRINPEHTELFEMLVNVIHQEAPKVKFAFSATRDSTPETALRLFGDN